MSWITENSLDIFQRFVVNVLKCGPIPKHVGIIMDGNRRYAKKVNVEKYIGHSKGFDKLSEALVWCKELGIKEVTVYAFSIENFKRTPKEVDELMNLAIEKFEKLLEEEDKLMAEGICVRVIGNMKLLREDFQKLIAKAMLLTKDNTNSILNIAFAYTSREEITSAIKNIVKGVEEQHISLDDVTDALISQCLYTNSNPDLLLRTSGEVRISDFLLWQISHSVIYFTDVLWPEFSFWNFILCILKYQKCYYQIGDIRKNENSTFHYRGNNERIENFLSILKQNELATLQSFCQ
ncbi:hypothetical protein HHI36_015552 [Cryptolaemus montrouzieri]|uniref:Alkyl transferase n=1 Tax=Cryptolaemus montrouzieri TaxID=559131 RepID=A0ABD2N5Y3_9CUCU